MKYFVEYFNGQNSETAEISADKFQRRRNFLEFSVNKKTIFLVAIENLITIKICDKNENKESINNSNEKIIRKLKLRKFDGIS